MVAALTGITRWVVRLFGAEVTVDAQITAEELRLIVERGGEQGILEAEEEQMINAVIELGDRRLHEVMVPRTAIVSLPASSSFDDALDTVIEQGHSRVPVYETSVDEVVGILYAKDLLPFLKSDVPERPDLRTLLRTPVFVPESMSIDDLLHEFQRRKVHIAIVLDEYGGTAGLVTIEDLLEEIVGEIQDEYDVEEPLVEQLGEDRARVDGRASVDDLLDLWDIKIPLEDDDEYDTVGGLVYHRIGGVPVAGRRGPPRRAAPHGGDDRRPARGQGAGGPRALGRRRVLDRRRRLGRRGPATPSGSAAWRERSPGARSGADHRVDDRRQLLARGGSTTDRPVSSVSAASRWRWASARVYSRAPVALEDVDDVGDVGGIGIGSAG